MSAPEDPPATAPVRTRPDGVTDAEVEALGKLSEALEWVERARGRLYDFHQLSGRADLLMGEAAELLEQAGRTVHAGDLRREIVGRNVIRGRWTFQLVEEYDEAYWEPVRGFERRCRDEIADGVRHLFEAEMKDERRSADRPGHEARPPGASD